jgi:hypothetical protein
MKKSNNTSENSVTINPAKYSCEFCNRGFSREKTIVSHICETKSRWLNRDNKGNRLGFQSWLQFYQKNSMSKTKNKTVEEFIRSPYYTAFAKFGSYCADANVINVSRYVDWLLKNQIKLDVWNTDSTYTRFLIEYLRVEDAFDAIHRSVEYCISQSENENIQPKDVLRYGNSNRICHAITTGKISPWMLYCSDSGIRFLETLNETQVKIVSDYINPEQWALKFHREPELKKQINDTLTLAGY